MLSVSSLWGGSAFVADTHSLPSENLKPFVPRGTVSRPALCSLTVICCHHSNSSAAIWCVCMCRYGCPCVCRASGRRGGWRWEEERGGKRENRHLWALLAQCSSWAAVPASRDVWQEQDMLWISNFVRAEKRRASSAWKSLQLSGERLLPSDNRAALDTRKQHPLAPWQPLGSSQFSPDSLWNL